MAWLSKQPGDGVSISGKDGANGVDGKVSIGKDGKDAVSISGKDGVGHIGLTGPAGKDGKMQLDITVRTVFLALTANLVKR